MEDSGERESVCVCLCLLLVGTDCSTQSLVLFKVYLDTDFNNFRPLILQNNKYYYVLPCILDCCCLQFFNLNYVNSFIMQHPPNTKINNSRLLCMLSIEKQTKPKTYARILWWFVSEQGVKHDDLFVAIWIYHWLCLFALLRTDYA